jgi:hypothetical protein
VIQCLPLADILKEYVGDNFYFDFFSLDVEGAELSVLESLDFSKVAFGIVFVECDGGDSGKEQKVRMILESNGYIDLGEKDRSCWFMNKDFSSTSYKHFMDSQELQGSKAEETALSKPIASTSVDSRGKDGEKVDFPK